MSKIGHRTKTKKRKNKMKKTLITLIALASLANADFTRSGDIVTDNTRGLMWQDDAAAASTQLTCQNAIDHCEALDLGGYTDWRLPNIKELKSIVDRSKSTAPIIYSAFQNTPSNGYWSATTLASNTSYAWYVTFYYGLDYWDGKSGSVYVRCVR